MPAANENDPLTDSALCAGDPLARALAALEPMPSTANRDQLMFAAGAAGRDRDVTFWKRIVCGQAVAAGLLVGVGIALSDFPPNSRGGGSVPFAESTPQTPTAPATKYMAPAVPPKSSPAPAPSAGEDADATAAVAKYLQLRSNVLALGVNALPNPIAPSPNLDVGKLEDSLQLPRGTFAIHGRPAKKKAPDEKE
ncbi:MAG: hypothetical protein JNK93_04795 [Planctomycetia bacterium]|nr:hypothetical protein [Planctomycetia bacterium]